MRLLFRHNKEASNSRNAITDRNPQILLENNNYSANTIVPVYGNKAHQTSDSSYIEKHKAKHKAKRESRIKFLIGGIYYQRIKSRDGSEQVVIGYECKKYIYSMKDIQMNIVIMKQISGPEGKKYTLDKHECKQFHIKWEPGLEVWPMGINWIPEKKIQKNC